jgi:hypothetical protein
LPDRVAVVTVAELVVAEREMEGVVGVGVGVEPEEVADWAEIRARNEAVIMSRRILLGHITRERGRRSLEKPKKEAKQEARA